MHANGSPDLWRTTAVEAVGGGGRAGVTRDRAPSPGSQSGDGQNESELAFLRNLASVSINGSHAAVQ